MVLSKIIANLSDSRNMSGLGELIEYNTVVGDVGRLDIFASILQITMAPEASNPNVGNCRHKNFGFPTSWYIF
jgi:hypothetical protein